MKHQARHKIFYVIGQIAKPLFILLLLGFTYLYIFQKFKVGIPCLFYNLTGWKCPGCGMTHALSEIWNGNFENALEYNVLSLTVLPIVCIYLLYRSVRDALGKGEGFYIWEYIMLAVLFITVLFYGYIRNKA